MTYVNSQAFAGRGTQLEAEYGSPLAFVLIAEIKTIQFTGSKYDLADVTNMESGNFREWLPTLADSGELSFTANYIPGDPTQDELQSLFNNATLTNWQVVLPNNLGNITFKGYVTSLDRDIPVDKEGSITGKIKITGEVTLP